MLKIRLQRTGKRGQAYFRVVVVEHTKKPRGEFLELLGNYNPHKKEFKVDMERVNYWISHGAQVSPTVNNLLVNYKYWDKPKMRSWKPKHRGSAEKTDKTEVKNQTTETPEESEITTSEAQKETVPKTTVVEEPKPVFAESSGEVK